MTFSTQDITKKCASLPASLIADDVNSALQTHHSLVITAPPGAGKSTLLPLTILSSLGEGEKIVNFAKVARATDEDIAKADAEVPDDMPAQDDAEKITTPLVTEETTDEEI